MIIFEGNPSKEVRQFITRTVAKIFTITAIGMVAIVYVPFISYVLFNGMELNLSMFNNFFMIAWPIGSIVTSLGFTIIVAKATFPARVTIESELEDGMIESTPIEIDLFGHKLNRSYTEIQSITKVMDYGTFYYLRRGLQFFICQKDLLVKGTIEEFEEIFQDKLIRKLK